MGRALAHSAALLAMATVVLALSQWLGRRGRVRLSSGKGIAPRVLSLGRSRSAVSALAALVAFVLVALPLLAVLLTSLQKTFGSTELTFAHWEEIASQRILWAAGRSLLLSLGAGAVVVALGLGVAVARQKLGRAGHLLSLTAAWPYAVPGTVLAMSLLIAFSQDLRLVVFERFALVLALGSSSWLLLVAYSSKHLAFGARNLSESMAQVDPALAEAARLSGAGPLRAFLDATLPVLRPAAAAAFTLTFLACATELTMSVLLVPPGQDVLGSLLFYLQTYEDPASASALACAFVVLVLGALSSLKLMQRRVVS
jgi:iron(III) transport system permease protein